MSRSKLIAGLLAMFLLIPSLVFARDSIIGLSSNQTSAALETQVERLIGHAVATLEPGQAMRFFDASHPGLIATFTATDGARAGNPRAMVHANRAALGVRRQLKQFIDSSAPDPNHAGHVHLPEFFRFICQNHAGVEDGSDIIVLGAPITDDHRAPSATMQNGRVPNDGHIAARVGQSIYATTGLTGSLAGYDVYLGLIGEPWKVSEAHAYHVERVWALTAESHGASLAYFGDDLNTLFDMAGKDVADRTHPQPLMPMDKLEMLQFAPDTGAVADIFTQPLEVVPAPQPIWQAAASPRIGICEERVARDGGQLLQCYTDHATSGASMMRPGIQMLMQDAASGKFDAVYAEALDRISRDQEDIAAVFKRLTFAGIRIITLSEGEVSQLHIGLKGTMNAMFLKDLADKTRRGLRGRVEKGRSGGGKCYGYDVVPGEDAGLRTINTSEAAIVLRIFEDYAAGKSPRSIAAALNKEGTSGPTGKGWGQSTINGNRQRGTGILNNELYIGRLVWNRLRYLKDPVTGKRVSKLNPVDDWITHDLPELRIVDAALWEIAKGRQKSLDKSGKSFWTKQRPRYLLSGLAKCGCCGGGFSMISQSLMGCSTARNKGTCDNRMTIHREKLEQDVLGALKEHLMEPKLCAMFCDAFTKHMNKLRREHDAATDHYRRELTSTRKKLNQMVDAIAEGAPVAPIKDKMHALENRRIELARIIHQSSDFKVAVVA